MTLFRMILFLSFAQFLFERQAQKAPAGSFVIVGCHQEWHFCQPRRSCGTEVVANCSGETFFARLTQPLAEIATPDSALVNLWLVGDMIDEPIVVFRLHTGADIVVVVQTKNG
jgi:hypothetical protein